MKILYSHRIRSRDGQAVHLEAMVAALRAQGHAVQVVGPAGFAAAGLGGASRWLGWVRAHLPGWAGELAEMAYALPATWRLARAARRFAPDVIYERANLFHPAGALVAAHRGVPLLLEVNAPLAEERARFGRLSWRRLAAGSERFVWRRASRVLPVTAVLAGHVAQAGVPPARIAVVANGIELADFPPSPACEGDGPVILGFIGFLREWHGLEGVLRALAAAPEAPRMLLRIVGEGPARPGLESLTQELGLARQVEFLGLAERHAVPGLIAGFDVALQPAAVPYACPLKLLEYMAAGRAIVAPDQPNLRELLEHDRTALLFEVGDAAAQWRAIATLAGDAALRRRLGDAARRDIIRRDMTWPGQARRVVALAEAAMAEHAAPSRRQSEFYAEPRG
jgi:glycosyltransferase involved in cell wall biosynthesis